MVRVNQKSPAGFATDPASRPIFPFDPAETAMADTRTNKMAAPRGPRQPSASRA
jgi:hypothetical protein